MPPPCNRVGRGEQIKRLLADKNGLSPPPSNFELTLGDPPKPSGGRRAGIFKNSYTNGITGPGSEGTYTHAGAGRGKILQHLASNGKGSDEVTNGSNRTDILTRSETAHVEEQLSSLHLSEEVYKGTSGAKATLVTNYFMLDTEPERGIYMYDVRFHPEIDSLALRKRLLSQLSDSIADTRSFDGRILYLPIRLDQKVTNMKAKHDGNTISVEITLVKKMKMTDREAIHLYNVMFNKIMNILGFVRDGTKFADPKAAVSIEEHRLEVWPGFVTSVQEYKGGVMLLCNASFRVLNSQTVYDLMESLIGGTKGNEWKETFSNMLINQTVLTRYNNKSYRIDEVLYDASPMNTFMRNGESISYVDYYQQHYDITIRDKGQPLLRGSQKTTIKGCEVRQPVDIMPELCYFSGITESMRNDNKVLKSIIQFSRISPSERQKTLERFLTRIHTNPQASQLLSNWGLRLANRNTTLPGRLLSPESIIFGRESQDHNQDYQCDWTRSATSLPVLSAVPLETWVILCQRRDENLAYDFVRTCMQVSPKMGIQICEPRIVKLRDDNTQSYIQELGKLKIQHVQLVFIMMPIARTDKYRAIKKMCCIDNPVPSQVALVRTLRNPTRLRSVAQKIVLQMNCKLGGTLWQVKMPLKNTMVVGLDAYHDPGRQSNSVGAVVASMNESMTRWYSTIYRQDLGIELMDGLENAICQCLLKKQEINNCLPQQIVVFRDGLGDGQLETCSKFEVPQIERACMKLGPDYKPNILFVVVQKRIQTRLLYEENKTVINPPPGTVMDHTITRKNFLDFFLVSQNVRQGTVTPTHYVVLHNNSNMNADKIQRLSYKMTHLYYNWSGTIRVPAPCQYAHKLAYLVGEHLYKAADESLNDKLFYL